MTREEALSTIAEISMRPYGLLIDHRYSSLGLALRLEVFDEDADLLYSLKTALGIGITPTRDRGPSTGQRYYVVYENDRYVGAHDLIKDLLPRLKELPCNPETNKRICWASNALSFWKLERKKEQKHFEKLHPLP